MRLGNDVENEPLPHFLGPTPISLFPSPLLAPPSLEEKANPTPSLKLNSFILILVLKAQILPQNGLT